MSDPSPAPPSAIPLVLGKRIDDIATLAKNPMLARLTMQELGVLLDLLDQLAVPAGTVVVRQGDEGDHMDFVLEGRARSQRGQLDSRHLGPGDHFGELALVGLRHRRTVEAETALRLARLPRARYQTLAAQHAAIALHFLQALVASLADELVTMIDRVGLLLRERSLPRRAQVAVRMGTAVQTVATGTAAGELLPDEVDGAPVVAALLDRTPVSLSTPVVSDATLEPVAMSAWEGREIYRSSVGLLLLEAARRVAPGLRLRLGPSLSVGRVVEFDTRAADPADLAERLDREMTAMAAGRLPFREEVWTIEEARVHLREQGWTEAAALLATWREPVVRMTSCGSVYALSNGPLLPSAEPIRGFRLLPHPEGLVIDFGEPVRRFAVVPSPPALDPLAQEQKLPRFGGEMSDAQRRWLRSLDVTSVGEFDQLCVTGQVSQIIRVSEGFHEKRIGQLADAVAARRREIRVIGIAGPSSSGKTTFIKRLMVQLEIDGLHPLALSLDDYYLDRDRLTPDEHGEYDYEALAAFDVPLLREHVRRLLAGEAVRTARFDFVAGKSLPDGGPELRMGSDEVLLIEGIHGLNPALLGGIVPRARAFHVFIHPATTLRLDRLTTVAPADLRLLRRIVRDRHQRNYTAADNILRWPSVRRGEALHIYPLMPFADAVFDSSLVYEPSVLKVYAERYLLEVPPEHPAYATAYRLRHLVDRFVAIYPEHVPPTSIAREFIGGSGFSY